MMDSETEHLRATSKAVAYLAAITAVALAFSCGDSTVEPPESSEGVPAGEPAAAVTPVPKAEVFSPTPTARRVPVRAPTSLPSQSTPTRAPRTQPPPAAATPTQSPTATPTAQSATGAPDFPRQTPFVPLDDPVFLPAVKATYLGDDDLVLGLDWMGSERAYPIRMIRFHHIVNDSVNGDPVLVTY
jgi:hypothetical protein